MVKTILIPTDFSPAADHALRFAIKLARKIKAKLTILHIQQIPLASAKNPHVANPEKVTRESELIEEYWQNLETVFPDLKNVQYETKVSSIYWAVELAETICAEPADMIVMGTTGASGFKEVFLGSNTARVIDRSPCPVLAIPEQAANFKMEILSIAYDNEALEDLSQLHLVSYLSQIFNTRIQLVHIAKDTESNVLDAETNLSRLKQYFGLADNSYHEIRSKDIESALTKYIEDYGIDLITMMPKTHSIFHQLFKGSLTQKIAFHSKTPLLAIPIK